MDSKRRFSELSEEEMQQLIDSKDSINTKRVIDSAVRLLKEYCVEKHSDFEEVEHLEPAELAG